MGIYTHGVYILVIYGCIGVRERETGPCTNTCLPPKCRCLCGKQVVKLFMGAELRKLGYSIPFYSFPCRAGRFTSKIRKSHSISQKIPIFLVILGKNVVHWDGTSGSGSGIRGLVVFFFFCCFYGLGQSLALCLTAKWDCNTELPCPELFQDEIEVWRAFGIRGTEQLWEVFLWFGFNHPRFLRNLIHGMGLGTNQEQTGRDQTPSWAVTQQIKEGCSPALIFPVKNSKMRMESNSSEQKRQDSWYFTSRSEEEFTGDFVFWTGNLKAEGSWEQFLAQEWLSGFLAPGSPSAVPGRWGVESWNPGILGQRQTHPDEGNRAMDTIFPLLDLGFPVSSHHIGWIFSISIILFLIFISIFLLLLQVLHPSSDCCWIFPCSW